MAAGGTSRDRWAPVCLSMQVVLAVLKFPKRLVLESCVLVYDFVFAAGVDVSETMGACVLHASYVFRDCRSIVVLRRPKRWCVMW